jgi:hypothetical protein
MEVCITRKVMFWLLIFQLLNETKTSTSFFIAKLKMGYSFCNKTTYLYKLKAPKLVAKIHQCNHFRME